MQRDEAVVQKITEEIRMAIELLGSSDEAEFLSNELQKRAICMTVINVGELVKLLSMEYRTDHPSIPWKELAGIRDIAAHRYQTLRMEDIYTTVKNDFVDILNLLNEFS